MSAPPSYKLSISDVNIIECKNTTTNTQLRCPDTPVLAQFISDGNNDNKRRFYIDLVKDMLAGTPVTGYVSKLQDCYRYDRDFFDHLSSSNYSTELKTMITKYENRVKALDLGIFTEKQNEARMSNGVTTKYSFATTTFPESGTHPHDVCVREPDDISAVINTAWVLDTASGSSRDLNQIFSNPNLTCDRTFTEKFGGFPDYFTWQTQNKSNIDHTNRSECTIGLTPARGVRDALSVDIDLNRGKGGIEVNGSRDYSGFYAQGNNLKNQKIATLSNTDASDILNIKESGDVAQVWMYYWYVIELFNRTDINDDQKINLLKETIMITTDSVVYMLCLILNLPVFYSGSREGVTSGNCTVKMYVAGKPNYQNTFNILKAIKLKNIQDKNLSTRAIFELLMDTNEFYRFYYMKRGERTLRKAQLIYASLDMDCVREVCKKYIGRIDELNTGLTDLIASFNPTVAHHNFQTYITEFDGRANGQDFGLCFSNDGFSSPGIPHFLINNDELETRILGCKKTSSLNKTNTRKDGHDDDDDDNGDGDGNNNNNNNSSNNNNNSSNSNNSSSSSSSNSSSSSSNNNISSSSSNSSNVGNFDKLAEDAKMKFNNIERGVENRPAWLVVPNKSNVFGLLHTKQAQLEKEKNFNESYYECLLACVVLGNRDLLDVLSNEDSKCQFLKKYDRFLANYNSGGATERREVRAFMQQYYYRNNNEISDPDNYVLNVGGALVTEVLCSFSSKVNFTHEPTAIDNHLISLLNPAVQGTGLGGLFATVNPLNNSRRDDRDIPVDKIQTRSRPDSLGLQPSDFNYGRGAAERRRQMKVINEQLRQLEETVLQPSDLNYGRANVGQLKKTLRRGQPTSQVLLSSHFNDSQNDLTVRPQQPVAASFKALPLGTDVRMSKQDRDPIKAWTAQKKVDRRNRTSSREYYNKESSRIMTPLQATAQGRDFISSPSTPPRTPPRLKKSAAWIESTPKELVEKNTWKKEGEDLFNRIFGNKTPPPSPPHSQDSVPPSQNSVTADFDSEKQKNPNSKSDPWKYKRAENESEGDWSLTPQEQIAIDNAGGQFGGKRRTMKAKKYLKNNRKKTLRKNNKKTLRKTIRKNKKTRKSKH